MRNLGTQVSMIGRLLCDTSHNLGSTPVLRYFLAMMVDSAIDSPPSLSWPPKFAPPNPKRGIDQNRSIALTMTWSNQFELDLRSRLGPPRKFWRRLMRAVDVKVCRGCLRWSNFAASRQPWFGGSPAVAFQPKRAWSTEVLQIPYCWMSLDATEVHTEVAS